jgi:hypothetical protein
MTEGKRPGGLTALAVINFIFFASSLASLGTIAVRNKIPITDEMGESQRAQIEAFRNMETSTVVLLTISTLAAGVLLLLSGIGYLKQRRFLGRILGNVYAAVAITGTLLSTVLLDAEIGGGFSLNLLISLIYPVLTLILINTTFQDDLVN